jgi:hypothetical protein
MIYNYLIHKLIEALSIGTILIWRKCIGGKSEHNKF